LTGGCTLLYKENSPAPQPAAAGAPDSKRMLVPPTFDPWRHRFTVLLAAATVVLLAAGALVTSTGSGLSVPDWPLSFGRVMPPMVGGVLFEHGHRMVASAVGALTVVLAFWYARRETRRGVRALAWTALGAVVAQGVLGGLTVLLRLPPAVSVLHACLAQGYFGLVVTLALVTSRGWLEARRPLDPRDGRPALFVPAAVAAALVYVQLALGALMRHTGAGLAIPDFPLAFGQVVPPLASFEIVVHFAHRVMALVVTGAVFFLAARAGRRPERLDLVLPARLAAVLVVIQIMLGAASVLSRLAVVPTVTHLVNGALLLATLLVVALRAAGPRVARQAAAPSALPGAARMPA
jgi:cytochrome c oxidase assembly protein subunit 15